MYQVQRYHVLDTNLHPNYHCCGCYCCECNADDPYDQYVDYRMRCYDHGHTHHDLVEVVGMMVVVVVLLFDYYGSVVVPVKNQHYIRIGEGATVNSSYRIEDVNDDVVGVVGM